MLYKTGVANESLVKSVFPTDLSSFKALIECYEEIPCNPCEKSCPFNAIIIGDNINALPKLIEDRCVGCSICVSVCPGLAILLVKVDQDKATFMVPYEMSPRIQENEMVYAINRSGEVMDEVRVLKVNKNLVTIVCDKKHLYDLVTIRSKHDG